MRMNVNSNEILCAFGAPHPAVLKYLGFVSNDNGLRKFYEDLDSALLKLEAATDKFEQCLEAIPTIKRLTDTQGLTPLGEGGGYD